MDMIVLQWIRIPTITWIHLSTNTSMCCLGYPWDGEAHLTSLQAKAVTGLDLFQHRAGRTAKHTFNHWLVDGFVYLFDGMNSFGWRCIGDLANLGLHLGSPGAKTGGGMPTFAAAARDGGDLPQKMFL